MTRRAASIALCFTCGLFAAAPAGAWTRDVLVAGIEGAAPGISPHGVTGLSFGPDSALYAGSVIGPGIYRIDVATGAVTEDVGAEGESDDVAVRPDGMLAWTAIVSGELRIRRPGEAPKTLVTKLPLINPVAFGEDGHILTGQIGQPDTLLSVDPVTGAVREIGRGLGGINAFQPDGQGGLWVPLAEKGAVGRVDLATGKVTVIADGLGQPVSVKRDSKGELYAVDWPSGRVFHVNPISGETRKVATLTPPLDNLAIGPDDTLYVSRPVDNAIIAVDPATGAQRPVVQGILAAPGGLAVSGADLLVADAYGTRTVDLATRGVTTVPFDLAVHAGAMVAASAQTIVLSNVRRGTLVIVDRKTGRARHSLGGFKAPMGVMIERDDTLLLVDYGTGELLRVTPGASPERAAVFGGLQGPVGLAAGPVGRVYVTEAGAGRIIAIDLAGGNRTIIAENLAQPEGIAVMPDGRLAVAEVGARRLLTVAPVTGDIGIVAEDLPMGAVFTRAPAPVYLPTGVAADSAGALYVVCDRDNTVLKFSP